MEGGNYVMSTEVDNRVVSMQFDNKQFEENVQTSLSTLEKLKQSLRLPGAAKGLEEVDSVSRKMDLSVLSNAAEAVRVKFSSLQVMAITALTNITNSAVNAGKRIVSSLTIDPIKMGFQEYETQINAVQTILANTESKGTTLPDVSAALDELNAYADKTIYNFTEMTRNIGTFTAAGVDLDTSVNAIQGIANLAAVSGSTSQQASTAMYQLSQALSSGTVKLMDWNSVVNAGMGGQVFQDALKETARVHGIAIDDMIEENGSFRETLQEGWLSSEILTETLQKFTMATEGLTEEQIAQNRAMLKSKGYTDEQIDGIFKLGDTATNAATKVKTFTQLMDTLKESAQSGWTQTWEYIIGDFEQAKELWTSVSDIFGGMINSAAEARNAMVKGWADGGGRDMLIESLKNAFEGLMSVITPIKEAFREVFPRTTSKQLLDITETIRDFTKNLKLSDEQSEKLKTTFKGLFAIVDIGVTFIKEVVVGVAKLFGSVVKLGGGLLDVTGSMGEWLSGLRDSVKESNVFGVIIGKITGVVQKFVGFLKEKIVAPGFEGFFNLMKKFGQMFLPVGQKIVDMLISIGKAFANAFSGGGLDAVTGAVNGGLFAGILVGVNKFVKSLTSSVDSLTGDDGILGSIKGTFGGIKDILGSVKGTLEAYQKDLQANTLLKIAQAIAILAAAIFVIALIDPATLAASLGAITVLFADLVGSMTAFSKIGSGAKKTTTAIGAMLAVSAAVLILAVALKTISTIDTGDMIKGILGISTLTGVVVAVAKVMASEEKKIMKGSLSLIAFALSVKILASACKDIAVMSWEELGKGLVGVGALLAGIVIFLNTAKFGKSAMSTATGMVIMAGAIKILASVCSTFGAMGWEEMAKGFVGIGGALAILVIGLNLMKGTIAGSAALLIAAGALAIMSSAMTKIGSMSWEDVGKSLVGIAGALLILAGGLTLMIAALPGAAALVVASGALVVLAYAMSTLGSMSWESIGKSLLMLASSLTMIGIAGYVLTPIIPTLLLLGAAFALMGVGTIALGAGLMAISAGLTALVAVFSASGAIIVNGITAVITAIIGMIPSIVAAIGEGIILICDTIAGSASSICAAAATIIVALVQALVESVPVIVDGVFVLLDAILVKLVEYTPKIVQAVFDLLMACLACIAENLPLVVLAAVDIVVSLVEGIAQSIPLIVQAGFNLIIGFLDGLIVAIDTNIPIIIEKVRQLFKSILRAAVLVLTGGIVDIKGLGQKIMNSGFIQGVKSTFSKVKSTVSDALNKAKQAIKDKISQWKQAGKDLINGLIQGVKDKFTSVKNAAVDAVSGAVSAVKEFLGINSPSKVFIGFGRYMDEGMVVGLKKYSSKIGKAATSVGDVAVNSMSKTLASISNAVNTDMDSQPTIRPVLDLSDVESGAGAINGMLSMQPSVGVLANVGSINSMMNKRQNRANDDIGSMIKELTNKINNTPGNTYIVNGVTYDDGSNVANAVGELVRAARIERRT